MDISNSTQDERPFGDNPGSVTVIISHKIKREHETDFKVWLRGINQEASRYQGYMGVQVVEPHSQSDREYVIIVRFDSYENLKIWNESNIRKKYLEKLSELTEGESTWKYQSGLEYWFTLPKAPVTVPPKKHKMASMTWLAITPLIMFIPPGLEPSLTQLGLGYEANTLIICAIIVLLMTYVVMPFMTKLFKGWLFSK